MRTFSPSSRSNTVCLVLLATLAIPGCKPKDAGGASTASSASAVASTSASAKPAGLPPPADVAAPPADAVKTASGLASKVLQPGTGTEHPSQNDTVKVNYTGWTTDGKMFDSSVAPLQAGRKAEPITFPLSGVIAGWTEGVQLMVVGEKRRFWIPQELAYKGQAGAPAGMLVFDVELLDITPGPKPPADVAAAPADAEKTKSGLASKVTQKGTGKDHPGPNDGVKVNYSIWQTDGKFLDGSKDKPMNRPVNGISEGWTEGVQLMVVGEKRTLWVPAAMAFKGRPNAPTGDITMVIELLDIMPGPKTPPDVKAPPPDAVKTADGVATKVLTPGKGTVHPTKTNSVTVNYAGWTTDGKMFDASYTRGEPATFAVTGVIPGWTEALQLMVEGEKRRIWIPEELAYKGKPGRPQGMLVFEVELLKISDAPPQQMPRGMGGPGGMHGMGGPGGMRGQGMRPGMGGPGAPGAGGAPPATPHP